MSDERPFAEEDAAENAPVIPNAADPQHHRRKRRAAKREADESQAFWKSVFATEVGRREMWDIIEAMHFHKERFVESSNGSPWREAMWAECGIQRIGFQLYRKWLALAPAEVMLMMQENDPSMRPVGK